jgi:hypothetical protein
MHASSKPDFRHLCAVEQRDKERNTHFSTVSSGTLDGCSAPQGRTTAAMPALQNADKKHK